MKRELDVFLTAIMFFTRIPVKFMGEYKEEYLNHCTRYFPVVGILVGAVSFFAYYVSSLLFPAEIAVIFSLLVGVLITGAFHEDGFGDVFDGFGGGWTQTKILEIMKDSRLGTYGTVALFFMFLLKFYALLRLVEFYDGDQIFIFILFVNYHVLARVAGISLSFLIPYSREDATSKVKPLAKSFTIKEVILVFFFGGLVFSFLLYFSLYYLFVVPVLLILVFYAKYYFYKWIRGFTGDCLGAVEQFAEVLVLLTILALCKFI